MRVELEIENAALAGAGEDDPMAALAWRGAPALALAAAAYAAFFSAARVASSRPRFSYQKWYAAFVALRFPVGVALTFLAF